MNWELDGVSRSERAIVEQLNDSYGCPIGVVVLGADSGVKARVYKRLRARIDKPYAIERHGVEGICAKQAEAAFKKRQNVIVCLSGEDTACGLIHKTVRQLTELGAKSVICVYVKVESAKKDSMDYAYAGLDESFTHQVYHDQVKRMRKNPPTCTIADAFITVRRS